MSAKSGRGRAGSQERERTRVYQARLAYVTQQRTRRIRDNVLAGVIGGLVIVGAIIGQSAFFALQQVAPEASPSPSPSLSSSPAPTPGSSSIVPTPDPASTP